MEQGNKVYKVYIKGLEFQLTWEELIEWGIADKDSTPDSETIRTGVVKSPD